MFFHINPFLGASMYNKGTTRVVLATSNWGTTRNWGRHVKKRTLMKIEDPHEKHFRVTEAFLSKYLYYYYYYYYDIKNGGIESFFFLKILKTMPSVSLENACKLQRKLVFYELLK